MGTGRRHLPRARHGFLAALLMATGLAVTPAPAGAAPSLDWTRQLATSTDDIVTGIATDTDGTTYVTGSTLGTLTGSTTSNAGLTDAFIAKYANDGTLAWVRQLGSTGDERGEDIALDGNGGLYVVGQTTATLPGSPTAYTGGGDAFIARYTTSGTKSWVRLMGTVNVADTATAVDVDGSGNAHLAGSGGPSGMTVGTGPGFTATFDASGARLLAARVNTTAITSLSVDSTGHAHLTGGSDTVSGVSSTDPVHITLDTTGAELSRTVPTASCPTAPPCTMAIRAQAVVVDGSGDGWFVWSSQPLNGVAAVTASGIGAYAGQTRPLLSDQVLDSPAVGPPLALEADGTLVYGVQWTSDEFEGVFVHSFIGITDGAYQWDHELVTEAMTTGVTPVGVGLDASGGIHTALNSAGQLAFPTPPAGGEDAYVQRFQVVMGSTPSEVSATSGDGALTVNFFADEGGSLDPPTYHATCTSPDGGAPGEADSVNGLQHVPVTGLTNGAHYTCVVSAAYELGTTGASAPSASILLGAPGAPTQFRSTAQTKTSISLAWTAPASGAPIDHYDVSCTATGGATGTATTADTSVTVTGLTTGQYYGCTLTAVNVYGTSTPPLPVHAWSATAPEAPTLGTPTGFVTTQPATAGSVSMSFTFGDDGGLSISSASVSCTGTGAATASAALTASPVTVTGLTPGASYTCTARASNAAGTGPASAPTIAFTPLTPPRGSFPAVKIRSGGIGTVTFAAAATGGSPILHYDVTCTSTDGGATRAASGATSPITVTGLTMGAAYSCALSATNAIGTGPSQLTAVWADGVPATPAAPAAVAGSHQATVSWTVPPPEHRNLTGYTVRRYAGGALDTVTSVPAASTALTVTGLVDGVDYQFTVAATNINGTGAASPRSEAVRPGAPTVPRSAKATAALASIAVTWTAPTSDNSAARNGYVITPVRNGVTQAARVVAATATSSTFTGLTAGDTWSFKVAARNSIGTGSPAAIGAVIVGSPRLPSAPASPGVEPTATGATVTWVPPAAGSATITGYKVSAYTAAGAPISTKTVGAVTTTTLTLTVGTPAYVKVAAVNVAGTGPVSARSFTVNPGAATHPTVLFAWAGTASAHLNVDHGTRNTAGTALQVRVTPYIGAVAQATQTIDLGSTAPRKSVLVSGLTAGVTYTFKISTFNGIAWSALSSASPAVTAL